MERTIENDSLRITINDDGAELTYLYNKHTKLQYMWNGNSHFWGRISPILFPVVGGLKDGKYHYRDNWYSLPKHGFARDMLFICAEQAPDRLHFRLRESSETRIAFPFAFELDIEYVLKGGSLDVNYDVRNPGTDTLLFSIGAHPAFSVPLVAGTEYHDYYLEFSEVEEVSRWHIDMASGLIDGRSSLLLKNENRLELNHQLFYEDALVFKGLRSKMISLKGKGHDHGLDFSYQDFPYFGVWAARNAPFVCLEPWCGIADSVSHDQEFSNKEGIISLDPGERFTRRWRIRPY